MKPGEAKNPPPRRLSRTSSSTSAVEGGDRLLGGRGTDARGELPETPRGRRRAPAGPAHSASAASSRAPRRAAPPHRPHRTMRPDGSHHRPVRPPGAPPPVRHGRRRSSPSSWSSTASTTSPTSSSPRVSRSTSCVALLGFTLPSFLALTLPMALLVAVLIVGGRLAADMEVTALKASGVSPLRLLRPFLAAGLVVTLLSAALTLWLAPMGNRSLPAAALQDPPVAGGHRPQGAHLQRLLRPVHHLRPGGQPLPGRAQGAARLRRAEPRAVPRGRRARGPAPHRRGAGPRHPALPRRPGHRDRRGRRPALALHRLQPLRHEPAARVAPDRRLPEGQARARPPARRPPRPGPRARRPGAARRALLRGAPQALRPAAGRPGLRARGLSAGHPGPSPGRRRPRHRPRGEPGHRRLVLPRLHHARRHGAPGPRARRARRSGSPTPCSSPPGSPSSGPTTAGLPTGWTHWLWRLRDARPRPRARSALPAAGAGAAEGAGRRRAPPPSSSTATCSAST